MKAAIGLAVVVAHGFGFVALAGQCRGTDLTVELNAPLASPIPALDGKLPDALARRVESRISDDSPGLVRRTWTVRYRGGFERTVGAAQLVGPFQDPAARACSGRIVVGQRLLDDGRAGPGTIAGEMLKVFDAELKGEGYFGIGDYVRIDKLALRWAQLEQHPEDVFLVAMRPHGYVRVTATVIFDRLEVPLVVVLVPEPSATELKFQIAARAELAFGNRVFQWVSDKLGGDKFATRLAQRQIDEGLITAFAPPPPFELPDGQKITFGYCDARPTIRDGEYGALPFGVAIGRVGADPKILPPRRGPAKHAEIAKTTALAIDLDLDALNALLYELWRSGDLDRRLEKAGLHDRFNNDPIVTEFLSLRLSRLRLALPPVISPTATGLRLSAEARVTILDGTTSTIGRVWGGLDFRFGRKVDEPVSVDLGALELTCERTPTTLVPCYADLVAALRDRGSDFHGELTKTFTGLLADIFVDRRLGASGLPADLVIRAATPGVTITAPTNASLHLDLDAMLVPVR